MRTPVLGKQEGHDKSREGPGEDKGADTCMSEQDFERDNF